MGAAKDVAEPLAGQTDRGRVDDRHELGQAVEQQGVEERLLVILELAEIDMRLEVGRLVKAGLLRPRDLLLERFLVRRQQALQPKLPALRRGERGLFVEEGALKQ